MDADATISAEARAEFTKIFGKLQKRLSEEKRQKLVEPAFDLLAKFPNLVNEDYDNLNRSPLCLLAVSGATLGQVEAVYQLNPSAMTDTKGELEMAQNGLASPDVLTFLLGKYPHLAKELSCHEAVKAYGQCAVHYDECMEDFERYFDGNKEEYDAIYSAECKECDKAEKQYLKLIHLIMELHPASCDGNLFKLSITEGLPEPTTDSIAAQLQKTGIENLSIQDEDLRQQYTYMELSHPFHDQKCELNTSYAKQVSKILPSLKKFVCTQKPGFQHLEGFTTVTMSLAGSKNLKELVLNVSQPLLRASEAARAALKDVLAQTPSLEQAHLIFTSTGHSPAGNDDLSVAAVDEGLASRQDLLKMLQLEGCCLQDGASLASIMASANRTQRIVLENIRWLDSPTWQAVAPADNCCLMGVMMKNCMTAPDGIVRSMMRQLANTPTLDWLVLSVYSAAAINITEEVVALVDHNNQLRLLHLWGHLEVSLVEVCGALQDNQTLFSLELKPIQKGTVGHACVLDLLKRSNTTITSFRSQFGTPPPEWDSIQHYLKLNSYGRQKAQTPNISKQELMALLHGVIKCTTKLMKKWQRKKGESSIRPQSEVPFLYELLHESASCWATHE